MDQSSNEWIESELSSRAAELLEPSDTGLWVHWSEPWGPPSQSDANANLAPFSDDCIDVPPVDHAADAWRRVASVVDARDACWRRCPAARGRSDCDILIELIRAYGRDPTMLRDDETARQTLCKVVCRTATHPLQRDAGQLVVPRLGRK
jgi:hypothetical protein